MMSALAIAALVTSGCPGETAPHWDGFIDAPIDTSLEVTDTSTDGPFSCIPGNWGCWGNVYYECAGDGASRINETMCSDVCDDDLGCVLCRPGSRTCVGNVSMLCASDGGAWITGRDCDEWGSMCGADGYCGDACGDAESSHSYVGCEYWPVALTNTSELNSVSFDFRVVVANPNDSQATVTVEHPVGTVVATELVAAGSLVEIALPWIEGQSFGIPGGEWSSIVVADGAYRLKSTLPVTVSQFNPFEYESGGVFSYTNDATLLLPTHVLTGDYVGLTYVPFSRRDRTTGVFPTTDYMKFADYLSVVGVTPEPTNVSVEVRGNAAAHDGGMFGNTPAGGTLSFTLARGQVATIASFPHPNCDESRPGFHEEGDCTMGMCDYLAGCREVDFDLTGSRITADQPVEVFGGHVCAYIPYYAQACDHLEVQLAPIQTWGRDFVSMPMVDQGSTNPNLVRVVAAFDGTVITVDPPQDGISTVSLDRYQWVEFYARSPFHVTGSHSIMVGQFLLGQYFDAANPAPRGDPAMTVLVPQEQYRENYTFTAPSSYNSTTNGQSYVLIVKPPGMLLTLDTATLSIPWIVIGGWEIGVVPVEGGTHYIYGDEPFGMITYGLGSFTSYAYPAGLNLEQITVII